MELKRKLSERIKAWKNDSQGSRALLIEGARRTGKSYTAEAIAKSEYRSYILIDFFKAPKEIKELFENYLDNLDELFRQLQIITGTKLYKRESLIIFDEVQMFPRARGAIKYLVADGRYDYIETGSLLSIQENVKDIIIPSEEDHITLHPLDFEEFLWAKGEELLADAIRENFNSLKPMGTILHRKALNIFREYMIVGGMPHVVSTYLETGSFDKADKAKRSILELYRTDIAKHAGRDSAKVRALWDTVPAQLSRHEKKFRITAVGKNARNINYQDAIHWLDDSGVVNICYKATEPSIGLGLNFENSAYKCYMADTGLLLSAAFEPIQLNKEEIYKKIYMDKLSFNKGMITENITAQMLRAAGHSLYYFSAPAKYKDTEEGRKTRIEPEIEIDFLIPSSNITSQHNINPIEVKSSNRYDTPSLQTFLKKYKSYLDKPYILHIRDMEIRENIICLPLYMTFCL